LTPEFNLNNWFGLQIQYQPQFKIRVKIHLSPTGLNGLKPIQVGTKVVFNLDLSHAICPEFQVKTFQNWEKDEDKVAKTDLV
jgi:hypothetical protein